MTNNYLPAPERWKHLAFLMFFMFRSKECKVEKKLVGDNNNSELSLAGKVKKPWYLFHLNYAK